jgi:hypothetical protein
MTDCELCCVSFEGRETVPEVGCGAVEGCAREVTHRGDGGAECPGGSALEGVELGVAKHNELGGEVLAKEETSNGADSSGLCNLGGGKSIDGGMRSCALVRANAW